jgi:hypothetical protein
MENIYVADTLNSRIQFFINDQTALPGNNLTQLDHPSKVLLDSQFNLYIVDTNNQKILKHLRY